MKAGRIAALGEKLIGEEEVAKALCRIALGRSEIPGMKGDRSP